MPFVDQGNRQDPLRKIGMGSAGGRDQQALRRFVGQTQQAMQTPTYNLPTIESVRIHYNGPLKPSDVQGSFGDSINPLGSNSNSPPPGANSVESTMAEPGKLQTFALIMAIGWHLEPEPMVWDLQGNAFTTPAVGTASPVSPDAFNNTSDITNTAAAPLGLTAGQTMIPALMQYGWWAEKAFYHMSRGYNLVWQWGNQTNIIRDSLRYTAYTPSSGQEGASSSAEVDSTYFVNKMNAYYRSQFNSPQIFLPIDRTRIGNFTLATSGVGSSVFRPTRAYEKINANFGGMGLRSFLRGNTEWRRLTTPFLMKPGVPIGLRADASNSDDQQAMQNYLSADYGFGGIIPANFTADQNINSGSGVTGTATIGAEPSLDAVTAAQGITTITNRVVFKGGGFKITVALKGYELTDDQAEMVRDSGYRQLWQSQCGCQIPG